jgi:hypothetical protein
MNGVIDLAAFAKPCERQIQAASQRLWPGKRPQSTIPAKSACATDGVTRRGKPGCAKIFIALVRSACPIVELADSAKAGVANVIAKIGKDDPIREGRQGIAFRETRPLRNRH